MHKKILKTVGTNVQRVGALERVTGEALFAGDMHVEGAVTLIALRSDRPHAQIVNIDLARALETHGCLRVFTAEDIPGRNRLGIINKDQHLLADHKVRCIGNPIALVAAETPEAAQQAVESIAVLYEDLPAVFDPEEALRPGAPLIHEKGNLLGKRVVKRGSPDAAFKEADVVVERIYTTPHIEHTYLEPDAGLAYVDPDGVVVVYAFHAESPLRSKRCR